MYLVLFYDEMQIFRKAAILRKSWGKWNERKTMEAWSRNGGKERNLLNSKGKKTKTKQKTAGQVEGEHCITGRTFELYSENLGLSPASAVCAL